MWRLIFFASMIAIIQQLQAQDASRIGKQIRELEQATTDSLRIYLMNQLCFNYSNVNPDSGIHYGEKAFQLAVKTKNARGIADSYNNRGWCYYRKSEYSKAEEFLLEALKQFEEIGNPKFLSVSNSNLGWVHFSQSHFPEAIKYFLETMKTAEVSGDTEGVSVALYSIGAVYNKQGNYSEARKYFSQSLELEKQLDRPVKQASCLSGIGNSYSVEGDFDKAIEYHQQALAIYTEKNDLYSAGIANENIGDAYSGKKYYNEALKHYQRAKERYLEMGGKEDISYINLLIGKALVNAGRVRDALPVYDEGLSVAKEINALDEQQEYHLFISNAYAQLYDFKNAYDHYRESMKFRDSIFTKGKQEELLRLQTEFETERKEKENQLLKADNEITQTRLQRNQVFLFAAIISIGLLLSLLYLLYRHRRIHLEHIKELRLLNTQLNQQKEEISRINLLLELKALRAQMNPHFIFNCMSSIQECILTERLDDANTYLSKLSRLLRMVLEYSDEESITLERELEMLQLYLELETVRLRDGFEYKIEVNQDIFTGEIQVPTLILQPFAENAIWHGLLNKENHRQLKIEVDTENGLLVCAVEDNGIGRKQSAALNLKKKTHVSRAIGINEERLKILKSQTGNNKAGIEIIDLYHDYEPAGTRVLIRIPLSVS